MKKDLRVLLKDRRVILLVKAVLTVVLLWLVIRTCSMEAVKKDFRDVRLAFVVLALALHGPGYLVSALRWKILLTGQGARVPLKRLLSWRGRTASSMFISMTTTVILIGI